MPSRSRADAMKSHEFTLVIEGSDVLSDEAADSLFRHGCDDATFGESEGAQFGDFTRSATSLADAIGRAIESVETAVPGTHVVRIEPDDLISAAEIAKRTQRSRESIRLLIEGERGPGGFPAPVRRLRARGSLWRWSDVARWFADVLGERHPSTEEADLIAAINGALEIRRLASRVTRPADRAAVARIAREGAALYGKPPKAGR